MRVLVVDDDYAKVELVCNAVTSAGVKLDQLEHVTTAAAARKALRAQLFDVVLIDVNLPGGMGDRPDAKGGFDLFDVISLDADIVFPADVIFVTSQEESVEQASAKAKERGVQLLFCSNRTDDWRASLVARLNFLKKSATADYADVVIVTAMRSPELDAVLQLPYSWKERRTKYDSTPYYLGEISSPNRTIRVCAVAAHRKGMPSSAALASLFALRFRPKYLVMLGICAGVPGKTNFGDVIVADPTWDWGSGKLATGESGKSVFYAAPHQMGLDRSILSVVEELS
ncbi:MAG: hypothetical protein QM639_15670 [Rhodocyclaceae bacterium]